MAEGPAQIPRQEGKAEAPEGCEGCVAVEVEFWGEGAKGVEDTRDDEGDESEDGYGQELVGTVRFMREMRASPGGRDIRL